MSTLVLKSEIPRSFYWLNEFEVQPFLVVKWTERENIQICLTHFTRFTMLLNYFHIIRIKVVIIINMTQQIGMFS